MPPAKGEPAPTEPASAEAAAPATSALPPSDALARTEPQGIALPAAPVRTQARHGIGLRLGPRATTVREDLLVPLTFSGGGPDLGASYRALLGSGLLDTRLEVGAAVVSNRFGHLGFTLSHSLTVAYRFPLAGSGDWRFSLGGVMGESTDSLGLEMWDDAHGYWIGLVFLGPSVGLHGTLSTNWQLTVTADAALIGTVGRPPEARHNKQDPTGRLSYRFFRPLADSSFFAPWDAQLVRFDVAAHRTVKEDLVGRGWSFGCQGRFARASEPLTILVFEAVLYAAWTWGI